jgi:hydrogenase maturation protease
MNLHFKTLKMDTKERTPVAISSDSYFFEKDKSNSMLIMGVGNYLMGDEGIGVHVIQEMVKKQLPDYVDILDGGTGGFLLLNCFEAYPIIIFVDATMDGKPEGTISLIRPKFASDFPSALSVHDVGLKDMIEAVYLMDHVPDIHLFTVSIKEINPMTIELNKNVQTAIPEIIKQILTLCEKLHLKNL